MRSIVRCILAVCCAALLGGPPLPAHSGSIYYYRDEQGVTHFTDLPSSNKFKLYSLFASKTGADRTEILGLVRKFSRLHDVDHHLIQAVLETESDYRPQAVSTAGAQGLMQIMPETQQDLGLMDPFEPAANIEAGVRYFKGLLGQFSELPLALAAYNAGPQRVRRYDGIPPYKETQRYVRKVMSRYQELKAGNDHVQSRE
ncbi:lytic transglycosylase domain-containing protein [Desulfohalobium retbaense]|uniref:Lytic transglycosylase catalytic n=1 Tax=Desulfohalobium retbaense (strain ATCC 49708 / DSM 5692 / JCM 16813 / HR100) TaxID=485915 RepID=C8X4I0_DESRD|nr:lytic transglycosylase domain-containing protein [Desulfohalobium retbaense]ACV69203.1 Lytic transglycosylase catalytic [Desulfohalobium retbaense DSM 5692]